MSYNITCITQTHEPLVGITVFTKSPLLYSCVGVGTVNSLEHKRCQDWNNVTYRGTPHRVSKKATEEWHRGNL